ncbi:PAS domain S-box protein [Flexithrix dorotheae]|uniref:PAS domain S-box protein n=1 Tax=Flexithrix dorotheae TaxID=70993 RepID=UPI00037BC628|nr:PAS domain S-box protein [Flexithrix dorotheae]
MTNQGNLQQNIKGEIQRTKGAIIDKVILASFIFGIMSSSFGALRDEVAQTLKFPTSWTIIMNACSLLILVVIYYYRKSLNITTKTLILSFIFLIVFVRGTLNYGWIVNGYVFLGFCSFIFVISFQYKTSIILNFLICLLIPLLGYFIVNNYIIYDYDFQGLIQNKIHWLSGFFIYLLFSSVIIIGIGQFQKELFNNFISINNRNQELQNLVNELNNQVQKKENYQQEMIFNENKFRSLFEASGDGILLIDENRNILEINPALIEITGYDFEDVQHINAFDVVAPDFRGLIEDRFSKILEGTTYPPTEIEILKKDGTTISVEIYSKLILNEPYSMILTSVRDISLRKDYEHKKLNAVVEAEEKERERFSRDLHDDLGPIFSTVKLYLQSLLKMEEDLSKKIILENLSNVVDNSVKQVREISHNLSPYILWDKGLIEAIKHHIDKVNQSSKVAVFFTEKREYSARLAENVEILIYRVFLELLNNTIKHSGADKVSIDLFISNHKLVLDYVDNGRGYDIETIHQRAGGGIGLKNIVTRIKAFRGKVTFEYKNSLMKTKISIPL